MCKHIWKTINDVRVCPRCGLTVRVLDGKIMLDKYLPNIVRKGKGNK